jgi:hypothetical protein
MNDGFVRRRLDPRVLSGRIPGDPLHLPLTDATITICVLAGGLAISGRLPDRFRHPAGRGVPGFRAAALWLQRRQAAPVPQPAGGGSLNGDATLPTGQHFPVPIVIMHGLIAATTLVLVLLTAMKVGGR